MSNVPAPYEKNAHARMYCSSIASVVSDKYCIRKQRASNATDNFLTEGNEAAVAAVMSK